MKVNDLCIWKFVRRSIYRVESVHNEYVKLILVYDFLPLSSEQKKKVIVTTADSCKKIELLDLFYAYNELKELIINEIK